MLPERIERQGAYGAANCPPRCRVPPAGRTPRAVYITLLASLTLAVWVGAPGVTRAADQQKEIFGPGKGTAKLLPASKYPAFRQALAQRGLYSQKRKRVKTAK